MAGRLSTGVRNALAGKTVNLIPTAASEFSALDNWTTTTSTPSIGSDGTYSTFLTLTGAGYSRYLGATGLAGLRVGQTYLFECYVLDGGTGDASVSLGTTTGGTEYWASGAITAATWTRVYHYFEATSATLHISLNNSDVGAMSFAMAVTACESHSLQDLFNGGELRFYTGTQPTSPDAGPTPSSHTLLCTVKNGGSTGVTWRDAEDGVIGKTLTETWNGSCVADGACGWFRVCLPGDSGASSQTDPRFDGSVTVTGGSGQITFASTTFTTLSVQTVSDVTMTAKLQA